MHRMLAESGDWLWWLVTVVLATLALGAIVIAIAVMRRPAWPSVGRQIRSGVMRRLSGRMGLQTTLPAFERTGKSEFAFLVLPDISGYTQFLSETRFAVAHAQYAVSQLLEAMITSTSGQLTPMKLEGDAVFFVAGARRGEDLEAVGRRVAEAVQRLNSAFYRRQRQLKQASACGCAACKHVEKLNLKTIVHAGEIYRLKVMGANELGGLPVIAAHRLLKEQVEEASYILLTAAAEPWVAFPNLTVTREIEGDYEGIGQVAIKLYSLEGVRLVQYDPPPVSRIADLWRKVAGLIGAAFRRA